MPSTTGFTRRLRAASARLRAHRRGVPAPLGGAHRWAGRWRGGRGRGAADCPDVGSGARGPGRTGTRTPATRVQARAASSRSCA
jgi:hypothetical protein